MFSTANEMFQVSLFNRFVAALDVKGNKNISIELNENALASHYSYK